jgi:hypothetical protein
MPEVTVKTLKASAGPRSLSIQDGMNLLELLKEARARAARASIFTRVNPTCQIDRDNLHRAVSHEMTLVKVLKDHGFPIPEPDQPAKIGRPRKVGAARP